MSDLFKFYRDRISSCPCYGFVSGSEILSVIVRSASQNSELTPDEFNSIINLAEQAHIKMMEDNYNAGWQDNQ